MKMHGLLFNDKISFSWYHHRIDHSASLVQHGVFIDLTITTSIFDRYWNMNEYLQIFLDTVSILCVVRCACLSKYSKIRFTFNNIRKCNPNSYSIQHLSFSKSNWNLEIAFQIDFWPSFWMACKSNIFNGIQINRSKSCIALHSVGICLVSNQLEIVHKCDWAIRIKGFYSSLMD